MKKSIFERMDAWKEKYENAFDAIACVVLCVIGAFMIWVSAWLMNN